LPALVALGGLLDLPAMVQIEGARRAETISKSPTVIDDRTIAL